AAHDFHLSATLARGNDARRVVVAIAVEQHAVITFAEPQHPQQVLCGRVREDDPGARFQRCLHVDAIAPAPALPGSRGAHAVASSIAARVTPARNSSSSPLMQYGGIQYSTSPRGRSSTPRSTAAR